MCMEGHIEHGRFGLWPSTHAQAGVPVPHKPRQCYMILGDWGILTGGDSWGILQPLKRFQNDRGGTAWLVAKGSSANGWRKSETGPMPKGKIDKIWRLKCGSERGIKTTAGVAGRQVYH